MSRPGAPIIVAAGCNSKSSVAGSGHGWMVATPILITPGCTSHASAQSLSRTISILMGIGPHKIADGLLDAAGMGAGWKAPRMPRIGILESGRMGNSLPRRSDEEIANDVGVLRSDGPPPEQPADKGLAAKNPVRC